LFSFGRKKTTKSKQKEKRKKKRRKILGCQCSCSIVMLPPSRGKTMEQKHHELWSKRAAHALRQTVRATRIIPAFSSSRFLAASALCCRIRAKRSARAILSETTKYLKKKNSSSKVSNKLINYRRE